MNYTRLALAAVVATVVDLIYGFVVYGTALASYFATVPGVFRPMDGVIARMPMLIGGTLLGMLAAAYIFAKGSEGRSGVQEGLRFGVVVAIFSAGYFSIANSAVMNFGLRLALVMSLAGLGEWIVVGIALGATYGSSAAAKA